MCISRDGSCMEVTIIVLYMTLYMWAIGILEKNFTNSINH